MAGVQTTTDLLEFFLEMKIDERLSVRTIEAYRARCSRFITWLNGRPITQETVGGYHSSLTRDSSLSPHTQAAYFRDVKVFCGWLVTHELLTAPDGAVVTVNPAKKFKIKLPKRRMASYSVRQLQALLAAAALDTRDRALILTLLDTGLRASELISMNREGIDWATGAFSVIGKGDKEREVWLNPIALDAIRTYLGTRTDKNPAIWVGHKGRLTISGVHQIIKRRAHQAGIRGEVRRLVHAMRATFAKHYIMAGGDIGSLQTLLGHEDPGMSIKYAALASDQLGAKKRQVNPLGLVIDEAKGKES